MSKTSNHGGARPGAGRPKGSLSGRKSEVRSICMSKEAWALIDRARGAIPRGKWIEQKLKIDHVICPAE